jgi:hypothetical protein
MVCLFDYRDVLFLTAVSTALAVRFGAAVGAGGSTPIFASSARIPSAHAADSVGSRWPCSR